MSSESQDEVPAVCETCLGPNPYLRMMREREALECKLCTRPFTVFKWAPEKNGAFKKTIICLTCSRQRNCCQSCLMDLTYGIPIQLRDAALKMAGVQGITGDEPKNEISKLYVANNSQQFQTIGGASVTSNAERAKEILTKLSLASKNNKNPKKLNDKSDQLPSHISKIDVTKIISKLPFNGSLEPPKDETITTLFIFGIDESLPEYKITDYFEQFGKIKSFNCQHKARAGFITFQTRDNAVKATQSITSPQPQSPGLLIIENIPLRITWGKERPLGVSNAEKIKVGSIVGKILKKFSNIGKEQKAIEGKKDAKDESKKPKTIKQPVGNEKITYKSTLKDFEL